MNVGNLLLLLVVLLALTVKTNFHLLFKMRKVSKPTETLSYKFTTYTPRLEVMCLNCHACPYA